MKYKLNIVVESNYYQGMEEGLLDIAARLRLNQVEENLEQNTEFSLGTLSPDGSKQREIRVFPEIDHSQKG